jgi:isoquinoline 1-oxidoreductase beta subunit
MTHMELSRRTFIVTTASAAGGLMLGVFSTPASAVVSPQPWVLPTDKEGTEISQWIWIDPEGIVTIINPHAEMGQGAFTSVPMMINEELQADWSKIRVQYADMNRHLMNENLEQPGSEGLWVTMSSGGSSVVKKRRPHMQAAGAAVRERLKAAAAQAWGVDASTIAAKDSVLSAGNRTGTYAEFATAAASIQLPEEPAIRTPDEFQFLGSSVARLDIPLKVSGVAQFPADVRLPGMVYASTINNPVMWGGKPTYDPSSILDRPGVIAVIELEQTVELGEAGKPDFRRGEMSLKNGLAVVADSFYRAKTALELMPISWDYGPYAEVSNEGLWAKAAMLNAMPPGEADREQGDAPGVIASAAPSSVIKSTYQRPYESHLRAEAITHVAQFVNGRYDAWIGAQHPPRVAAQINDQLGIEPKDCYLHRCFLAGGFSSSSGTYSARQTAVIAAALDGTPVQVRWTREEDTRHGTHRTLGAADLTAVIGPDGLPLAQTSRHAADGQTSFARQFGIYDIPNYRWEYTKLNSHISTTTHRNPTGGYGGFITESFVDEMALAGGWDPLEWRLKMATADDAQLVLKTLKEHANFTTDLPKGEGMGVALVDSHGTLTGCCATVSVTRRGSMRVEKMVVVLDPGHIINPLNCKEQSEGSVVWGLSHSMIGGIEIANGQVQNDNFDKYQILRIQDMPEIETYFALSGGDKWGGMGEPAVSATEPAMANALFFATGKRVYRDPVTQADLSWS